MAATFDHNVTRRARRLLRYTFFCLVVFLPAFWILLVEYHQHAHRTYHQRHPASMERALIYYKSSASERRQRPNYNGTSLLPPLESVLQTTNKTVRNAQGDVEVTSETRIVGDVSSFLDFAVVGFGKCGTTTLLSWLDLHPNTQVLHSEVYSLIQQRPYKLIERIAKNLQEPNKLRGYKCPQDVHQPYVLEYYRTIFHNTKLLLTLRHPVLWFQSLYNFRIQNFLHTETLLHPNQLIGRCTAGSQRICSSRGNFAYILLQMGKQYFNLSDTAERPALQGLEYDIQSHKPLNLTLIKYTPNPVFLMDLQQLADTNGERKEQLARDLQDFLGLPYSEHFAKSSPPHETPGKMWNATVQAEKDKRKMDICEDQYLRLRQELMQLSRKTSLWLRNVFFNLPTVHVSSREYYEHILATDWMEDPCGDLSDKVSEREAKQFWEDSKVNFRERVTKKKVEPSSSS